MKIRPLEVDCSKGTDIQTDRNDEADSRSSQFCLRAQKLSLHKYA
jgi:hypothetical protein